MVPEQTGRDIDVVSMNPARTRSRRDLFDHIGDTVRGRGFRLERVEGRCLGEARTAVLNRARIALSLTRYPREAPGIRFVAAMACGALVVSEELGDPSPFRDGEHFVAAPSRDLTTALLSVLESDDERHRLVDAAARFVTEALTLRRSVDSLLRSPGRTQETIQGWRRYV